MENQKLSDISKESGRSISTVSKVLRGCPGVTEETRNEILRVADRLKHPTDVGDTKKICVILPDNPKYFWKPAREAISEFEDAVSLRIYSAIRQGTDSDVIARYLKEAVSAGARAIILAARPDEKLRLLLTEYANRVLILQMCEYVDVRNTFFVGSDGYCDGKRLAAAIPTNENRSIRVGILNGDDAYISERRIAGFLDGLPASVAVYHVTNPPVSELYSAHLAREIDRVGVALDYLFCYDGVTASACEALHKLRGKMSARLLGFECEKRAEKHFKEGRIAALLIQHPELQMKTALSLADRYVTTGLFPDQKFHYLMSEFINPVCLPE